MADRRFTKNETAKILRKAVELQGQSSAPGESDATSEAELRSAAKEIGLSPIHIDAAIACQEGESEPSTGAGFWGGPLSTTSDFIFEGTMTEDQWEDTVADLRKTFGEQGKIELRGTTHEWTSSNGLFPASFTVRPSGKHLRVSTSMEFGGLAVISYIVSMLPMLIGVAVIEASKTGLGPDLKGALLALYLLAIFGTTRGLVSKSSRKLSRALDNASSRFRHRTSTELDTDRLSGPSEKLSPDLGDSTVELREGSGELDQ